MIEHVAAVGHLQGQVHVLLHQQHPGTGLIGDAAHHRHQFLVDHRGQSQAHLVHHQQLGLGDDGAGQRQHLLLAAAEQAGPAADEWTEGGKEVEGPVNVDAAAGLGQLEILPHRQLEQQAPVLGHVAHTPAGHPVSLAQPGHRPAHDGHRAGQDLAHARNRHQRRGLACAVGAQQRHHLARVHMQAQAAHYGHAVVAGVETLDGQQAIAHWSPPLWPR